MINYQFIGSQIRKARKSKKLTQRDVSSLVQISLSYYGHIERGTRITSLETFIKIINALELSPDQALAHSYCP